MIEVLLCAALVLVMLVAIFAFVVVFLVYRALVAEKMIPKMSVLAREPPKRKTPRDRATENILRANGGDG